ncbi:MAG: MFS transporter [Synechococcales cyanobacterium]
MLFFLAEMTAFLPILPLYITGRWGATAPVGWIVGSFAVGVLLARPLVGWALDRWGRKPLLWLGLVVALAVQPLYAAVPDWGSLMAVRFLHGLSLACFATASHTLVADLSPPQERVAALGYLGMTNTLGFGLGPALASIWYRQGGFDLAVHGLTFFLLLAALFVLWVPWIGIPSATAQERQGGGWRYLGLYPVREATFFVFIISATHGAVTTFLPLWLPRSDLFYLIYALGAVLVRFSLGRWGQGIPAYRGAAVALISSGIGVMGLAAWPEAVILWAFLYGVGFGLLFPVMSALVSLSTPAPQRGRVYGLFLTGVDLGVAVGSTGLEAALAWLPLGTLFYATGGLAIGQGLFAFRRLQTPMPVLH